MSDDSKIRSRILGTILGVDTALGACSVAVLAGDKVLARRFVAMDRGHAEALAPMVQEAMQEASFAFSALAKLAVTTGPGTFTGQRVGLAFMRALKVALRIPCLGVTTLAAMAAQACAASDASRAVVAHDARRGEIYCGVYANNGQVLMPPTLLTWEAAPDAILALDMEGVACTFAGTATSELLQCLQEHSHELRAADFRDLGIRQPDAEFVARLAGAMPVDNAPPQPLYLRAPDAKLPSPKKFSAQPIRRQK